MFCVVEEWPITVLVGVPITPTKNSQICSRVSKTRNYYNFNVNVALMGFTCLIMRPTFPHFTRCLPFLYDGELLVSYLTRNLIFNKKLQIIYGYLLAL